MGSIGIGINLALRGSSASDANSLSSIAPGALNDWDMTQPKSLNFVDTQTLFSGLDPAYDMWFGTNGSAGGSDPLIVGSLDNPDNYAQFSGNNYWLIKNLTTWLKQIQRTDSPTQIWGAVCWRHKVTGTQYSLYGTSATTTVTGFRLIVSGSDQVQLLMRGDTANVLIASGLTVQDNVDYCLIYCFDSVAGTCDFYLNSLTPATVTGIVLNPCVTDNATNFTLAGASAGSTRMPDQSLMYAACINPGLINAAQVRRLFGLYMRRHARPYLLVGLPMEALWDTSVSKSFSGDQFARSIWRAPASGAADTDYALTFGNTSSTAADDPVLMGAPGKPDTYLAMNSAGFLRIPVNTAFLSSLHKTTGGVDWGALMAVQTMQDALPQIVFSTRTSSSSTGINPQFNGAATYAFVVGITGDTANVVQASDYALIDNAWTFMGIGGNGASGLTQMEYFFNSTTPNKKAFTPNASTNNPSGRFTIMAGASNGSPFVTGSKFTGFALVNSYPDAATARRIADYFKCMHPAGRAYTNIT